MRESERQRERGIERERVGKKEIRLITKIDGDIFVPS